MRCFLSTLMIVACLASLGCDGTPRTEADLGPAVINDGGEFIPNAKIAGKTLPDLSLPETIVILMEPKLWPGHVVRAESLWSFVGYISNQRMLAVLLESCDARSPFREYNTDQTRGDTIDTLLVIAQADIDDVQEAAALFLQGATSSRDLIGREDLLEMLLGLMVDYPDRRENLAGPLKSINGKLIINGEWPSIRMGLWKPRQFAEDLAEGIYTFGRRDLTSFIANNKPGGDGIDRSKEPIGDLCEHLHPFRAPWSVPSMVNL